jgi:AbrB family looped-hinge helix DNA binding protein
MVKVKASSKGQIVIPKEIREKLGIRPGSILNVTLEGNKIVIEPSIEPPIIQVEIGDRSGELLRELRDESEEKIKKLLKDLGVEIG